MCHSISLSKEFLDIKTNCNKLIESKKYEEKKDSITLLANNLFDKLCTYHDKDDKENLKSCVIALQSCDEEELVALLSQDKLQKLLNILLRDEEYEFAATIRDILHTRY
jgi:hypothetical protein